MWSGPPTKKCPWKWRRQPPIRGCAALCTMKQVGVNVASDFLLHLAEYGSRAGLVLVTCEDPGSLSSTNEGDSRPYSKMMEFPLIEPGDIQEAKDMTRWAFELSETIRNVVMLRSVTRMSHASGNVTVGDLAADGRYSRFPSAPANFSIR